MSAEEEPTNQESHKLPFLCHSCHTQFDSAAALFSHAETCQEQSDTLSLQEELDNKLLDQVEQIIPVPEVQERINDLPEAGIPTEEVAVPGENDDTERIDVMPSLPNDTDNEKSIIESSAEPNSQVETLANTSDLNGLAVQMMDSLNDLTASIDDSNIMVLSAESNAPAELLDESKKLDEPCPADVEIKVEPTEDSNTPMDGPNGQSPSISGKVPAEVLLQDFDDNIPLECAKYAIKHGKHAAQLEYLKRYPNMKISWERIGSWISNHGLKKRYDLGKHHSRKPRPEIPTVVMKECVEYAMENGNENAQIKLTLKYPEHVFLSHLIQKWVYNTKQGKPLSLGKQSPVQVKVEEADVKLERLDPIFPATFIELVKNRIVVTEDLSDEDLLQQIQTLIKEHNEEESNEDKVEEGMDPKVLLSLKHVCAKFHCKGCKCMYRTQEELAKHKVKCWVPDFDESGLTRSQRACRTKLIKDEIEDSGSETEIMGDIELPSSFQSTEKDDDLQWPCDYCNEAFTTKSRWYHHRQKVHKIFARKSGGGTVEKRNPIEIIKNRSKRPSPARRVSPARSGRSEDVPFFNSIQFTCSKCARVHISKAELSDHLRVSHDIWLNDKMEEISLRCNECEILCFSYAALINHQKSCTNELVRIKYTTDKLQKDVSNFSDAVRPIIFLCPRCYVRFASLDVLGNHYIAKTCTRVPRPTDPDYRIPV